MFAIHAASTKTAVRGAVVACFIYGLLQPAWATSVALMFGRGRAAIAADSLIVVLSGDRTSRQSVCKIVDSKGVVFAGSGFLLLDETAVKDIALRAIKATPTLDDARDAFQEAVTPALLARFSWARHHRVEARRELVSVFASIVNSRVIVKGLILSDADDLPFPVVRATRFDCGKECVPGTFMMLGSQEVGKAAFRDLLKDKSLRGWRLAARLVEIEAAADPASVGGPLQVVELSRKGVRWVQKPEFCEDLN